MRAFSAKRLRKVRPATVTGKTVAGNGAVVAFVGSDGSGKSTVTGETRKWLGYKLDVHGYYMGSGQSSTRIYDVVRHAIKARSRKGNVKVGTRPEKQRAPRFHDRVLALRHLLAIRSKVRSLRQAHRLAASGSLVVLDRFPQTQFSSIYDGPRLQNGNSFGWAARAELDAFHEAASLAPHLVVKLVVPPEIGHSRKPDHNFATIKRKAEITEQLQFPQSRVSAIDASQPLDQVMLAVKKAVWRILRERAEEEAHGNPAP